MHRGVAGKTSTSEANPYGYTQARVSGTTLMAGTTAKTAGRGKDLPMGIGTAGEQMVEIGVQIAALGKTGTSRGQMPAEDGATVVPILRTNGGLKENGRRDGVLRGLLAPGGVEAGHAAAAAAQPFPRMVMAMATGTAATKVCEPRRPQRCKQRRRRPMDKSKSERFPDRRKDSRSLQSLHQDLALGSPLAPKVAKSTSWRTASFQRCNMTLISCSIQQIRSCHQRCWYRKTNRRSPTGESFRRRGHAFQPTRPTSIGVEVEAALATAPTACTATTAIPMAAAVGVGHLDRFFPTQCSRPGEASPEVVRRLRRSVRRLLLWRRRPGAGPRAKRHRPCRAVPRRLTAKGPGLRPSLQEAQLARLHLAGTTDHRLVSFLRLTCRPTPKLLLFMVCILQRSTSSMRATRRQGTGRLHRTAVTLDTAKWRAGRDPGAETG